MSFAAVLIALVELCEIFAPGCGSNVSSWLGPPAIHSTISDFAGLPLRRFFRGPRQPLRQRRQPADARQAQAAANAERREK